MAWRLFYWTAIHSYQQETDR